MPNFLDTSIRAVSRLHTAQKQTMYGASVTATGPGRPWICRRCLGGLSRNPLAATPQRRWIGMKVLAKRKMADEDWAAQAEAIEAGTKRHIWDIFEERGYIKDVAG